MVESVRYRWNNYKGKYEFFQRSWDGVIRADYSGHTVVNDQAKAVLIDMLFNGVLNHDGKINDIPEKVVETKIRFRKVLEDLTIFVAASLNGYPLPGDLLDDWVEKALRGSTPEPEDAMTSYPIEDPPAEGEENLSPT